MCTNETKVKQGYYKDENTSIYYKCGQNCENCLNESNCIKCYDNHTKINNPNSSCYLINNLIPYYVQDPNDEYNYLICEQIYDNCLDCNNLQCLTCKNEYIFIDNDFTKCMNIKTNEIIESSTIIEEKSEIFNTKEILFIEETSEIKNTEEKTEIKNTEERSEIYDIGEKSEILYTEEKSETQNTEEKS